MGEPVTTIESLADVRPGDLCFTRIGGIVPGFFPVAVGHALLKESVRVGRIRCDHVLIATEVGAHNTRGAHAYVTGKGRPTLPGPLGVQAMPDGAEEIELTPEHHWNDEVVWFRLPQDWPGQAADAAAIARLMVKAGVEYSFASYAMLAAWQRGWRTPRLEAHINRRTGDAITLPRWSSGPTLTDQGTRGGRLPAEAICSVLVDQAWTLAGKRVMRGTKPQVVTPGALALQLWNRAGVIRGGPGILS